MPGFLGITSIAMIHHGKSSKIQGVDVLRACQYSAIITPPGKMPAFISLSGMGTCGEEDFRWRGWKKARLPVGMAGILQAKKAGYRLDISRWIGKP